MKMLDNSKVGGEQGEVYQTEQRGALVQQACLQTYHLVAETPEEGSESNIRQSMSQRGALRGEHVAHREGGDGWTQEGNI